MRNTKVIQERRIRTLRVIKPYKLTRIGIYFGTPVAFLQQTLTSTGRNSKNKALNLQIS